MKAPLDQQQQNMASGCMSNITFDPDCKIRIGYCQPLPGPKCPNGSMSFTGDAMIVIPRHLMFDSLNLPDHSEDAPSALRHHIRELLNHIRP